MAVGLAAGALGAVAGPASAEDRGAFGGSCDPGQGCFWEGYRYQSAVLGSRTRDSYFSNNYYANVSSRTLNDRALEWNNTFSTLYIQSFLDSNYVRPTFCLPPGYAAGPYPFDRDGLSSFKSC